MISESNPHLPGLIEYLARFVTPKRFEKMRRTLEFRTRYVTVVLEDIFQPHNASAVLRSCDAFGIQEVVFIENRNRFRVNKDIALGTSQWLDLQRFRRDDGSSGSGDDTAPGVSAAGHHPGFFYRLQDITPDVTEANARNTLRAIRSLKDRGYRIVATAPDPRGCELAELDLTPGPCALLFGTELEGLSRTALENADEYVSIPMHGFVESFNISVSAAVCLYDISTRLRASSIPWKLSESESEYILYTWLRRSVRKAHLHEQEYLGSLRTD